MSASERLRQLALEAVAAAEHFPGETLTPHAQIIAVLPEIVAVIEGAENLPEFFQTPDGQTHSFVLLLDALEEKLKQ